ncbi:cupredoxin domain-containing protein [Microbulbifer sp. SSSA002]|uniref:cupredoxin domain-containing protein n=1 Tax=unclassified Microbulbifer TaxID=2619833 RepID=UPI0040394CD3
MAVVLVNIAGALMVLAVIGWFWLVPQKRASQASPSGNSARILVKDGVYEPDLIRLPAGGAAILHFYRQDPSPCSEWVLFPDLEISAQLALNQDTPVEIPTAEPGEYPFTCQMQMYRGTLILE